MLNRQTSQPLSRSPLSASLSFDIFPNPPYTAKIMEPPTNPSPRAQRKGPNQIDGGREQGRKEGRKEESKTLTFVKPMSWLFSRKHWRQMLRPYFRIRPALWVQTRLCCGGLSVSGDFLFFFRAHPPLSALWFGVLVCMSRLEGWGRW